MLQSLQHLSGFKLHATDGDIGSVQEWYFDDFEWTIRYLVVDTGNWLIHRKVLVPPYAFEGIDRSEKIIRLNISKQQVEDSPPIETHQTVSRQREQEYFQHFGWPWYGAAIWEGAVMPMTPMPGAQPEKVATSPPEDVHLRSAQEVKGYRLRADNETVGRLEDYLVEDSKWFIQYLVVSLTGTKPAHHTLMLPGWVDRLSWRHGEVRLKVPANVVRDAPVFVPTQPLTREREEALFKDYYGKVA